MGGGISKKKYEELEFGNKQLLSKIDGLKENTSKKEKEYEEQLKKGREEISNLSSKLVSEHGLRIKIEDDLLKEKNFKLKLGEEVLTSQNENEQLKINLEKLQLKLDNQEKEHLELAQIEKEKHNSIVKRIRDESVDKNRILHEKTEAAQEKFQAEHEKLLSLKALLHEENLTKVKLEHEVEFIQREREHVQSQLLSLTQNGEYFQHQDNQEEQYYYPENSNIENEQQIQIYHGEVEDDGVDYGQYGDDEEKEEGGGGGGELQEHLLMEKDAQIYELENEKEMIENNLNSKIIKLQNEYNLIIDNLKKEKNDIEIKYENSKNKSQKQISDLMSSHSSSLQKIEMKNTKEMNKLRDQVLHFNDEEMNSNRNSNSFSLLQFKEKEENLIKNFEFEKKENEKKMKKLILNHENELILLKKEYENKINLFKNENNLKEEEIKKNMNLIHNDEIMKIKLKYEINNQDIILKLTNDFELKQKEIIKEKENENLNKIEQISLNYKKLENDLILKYEKSLNLIQKENETKVLLLENNKKEKENALIEITNSKEMLFFKQKEEYEEEIKKNKTKLVELQDKIKQNKLLFLDDSNATSPADEVIALKYINNLKVNKPTSSSTTSIVSMKEASMKCQIRHVHYQRTSSGASSQSEEEEEGNQSRRRSNMRKEVVKDSGEYARSKLEAAELMADISNKTCVSPDTHSSASKTDPLNFSGSASDMLSLMAQAGIVLPETMEAALKVAKAPGSKLEDCVDPMCTHDHAHHHHEHDEGRDGEEVLFHVEITQASHPIDDRTQESKTRRQRRNYKRNDDDLVDKEFGIKQDDEHDDNSIENYPMPRSNQQQRRPSQQQRSRRRRSSSRSPSPARSSINATRPSSAQSQLSSENSDRFIPLRPSSAQPQFGASPILQSSSPRRGSLTLYQQQQQSSRESENNDNEKKSSHRRASRRSSSRPRSAPSNNSRRTSKLSNANQHIENNNDDNHMESLDQKFASTAPATTFNFTSLTDDNAQTSSRVLLRGSSAGRPSSALPVKVWPARSGHIKLHPSGSARKRQYRVLIDASSSMRLVDDRSHFDNESRWKLTQKACERLIPQLSSKESAGLSLYFFSQDFKKFTNIRTVREVTNCFDSIYPKGGTHLTEALRDALGLSLEPNTTSTNITNRNGGGGEDDRMMCIENKEQHIEENKMPVTVLILTDGAPNNRFSVEEVIREANDQLKFDDDLSILIIQIGYDIPASRWLKSLEDRLQCKEGVIKTTTLDDYSESKTSFPMYVVDIVLMSQQKTKWRAFKKNGFGNNIAKNE